MTNVETHRFHLARFRALPGVSRMMNSSLSAVAIISSAGSVSSTLVREEAEEELPDGGKIAASFSGSRSDSVTGGGGRFVMLSTGVDVAVVVGVDQFVAVIPRPLEIDFEYQKRTVVDDDWF